MLDIIIYALFGTVIAGTAALILGIFGMLIVTTFKYGGFLRGIVHVGGWALMVMSIWPGYILTWSYEATGSTVAGITCMLVGLFVCTAMMLLTGTYASEEQSKKQRQEKQLAQALARLPRI